MTRLLQQAALSMMRIMTGRMNAATVVANRSKSRGIAKLLQLL
jgi:hypothetical protein